MSMDRAVEGTTAAEATIRGGHEALVELARSGDADAFDRLVATRVDAAFRTARAILRDDADASDATQEAFFQIWRDLPRLRDLTKFDAWAGRILLNRCRTLLRRRPSSARQVRLDADYAAEALGASRSRMAEELVEADAIRRAFARLSDRQRELLAFHHVGGRSVADLAAMTGAPVGTTKWRLHDARQALERALEAER